MGPNTPYSSIFGFGNSPGFMPGGFFGMPANQPVETSALGSSFLPSGEAAGGVDPSGWFGKIGGLEGLGQITKGLASLGSIYSAIRGLGLAEDQFKFSKQAYQENLANSKQSYNTSLEDRIRARYNTEGRSASAVQSYLDKHSL